MIVAVSGMVGTGKSTAVKHILDLLQRHGVEAVQWRFQRLPCITFTSVATSVSGEPSHGPDKTPRGQGYRSRTLTLGVALGYLARAITFRVYRRWPSSPPWVVSNRYFYDSFAHFDLSRGRGSMYAHLLERLLPKPDLAFLMVASRETLAARRPQYSVEYIDRVATGYQQLRNLFPELVEVSSETDARGLERIEGAIQQRLGRS